MIDFFKKIGILKSGILITSGGIMIILYTYFNNNYWQITHICYSNYVWGGLCFILGIVLTVLSLMDKLRRKT